MVYLLFIFMFQHNGVYKFKVLKHYCNSVEACSLCWFTP